MIGLVGVFYEIPQPLVSFRLIGIVDLEHLQVALIFIINDKHFNVGLIGIISREDGLRLAAKSNQTEDDRIEKSHDDCDSGVYSTVVVYSY